MELRASIRKSKEKPGNESRMLYTKKVARYSCSSGIQAVSLPKALEESIDFSKFKCEKQEFADYLRSTAPEDDKNNVAKVWVFTSREREIIGYVTLIMSQLSRSLHPGLGKLTTHLNVPAILISEMAGHIDYAGRGLGRLMLDWVVSKALDLSQYVACRLVIVESLPDKVDVYKHWGFQPINNLEEKRNTMFLMLAAVIWILDELKWPNYFCNVVMHFENCTYSKILRCLRLLRLRL
jgi:hypothetical protein